MSQTDADGRVTTYSYNSLGQQTAENWLDAEGNPIYTFTYGYDTLGDLVTASDPTASYAYDYNSLGEATSITQSIAGLTPSVTLTQQFDAAGDRTQLAATIGGTADFVNNYTYDLLGEMTQVTQSGVTGGNAVAAKTGRLRLQLGGAAWQRHPLCRPGRHGARGHRELRLRPVRPADLAGLQPGPDDPGKPRLELRRRR